MKYFIRTLFLLVSVVSFSQHTELENLVMFNKYCLKNSSTFSPCISINEDGIVYNLLFENLDGKIEKTDINKILIVGQKQTNSPNFKTSEGLTIENTYADLKNYSPLKTEPGWGHYVELPSGWWAVFFSIENPKEKPKETDKITFFCKKFR